MFTAEEYIKQLHLTAHPEGGYYQETYRSPDEIKARGFDGNRSVVTSIYFLLQDNQKSHLHRIKSDEQWYFHVGETLEIIILNKGKLSILLLGTNMENGEVLHITVPAGAWFGSRLINQKGFVLVSCVVAPGFDFRDFELASYEDLSKYFPELTGLLKDMCIQ